MDMVRAAIDRPVGVAVGVILVVMFGLIGVGAIPIQLTPTIDRPVITVSTAWPGRSPQEVVDEITKEQEERLKNVSNLKSMQSLSNEGSATITLEFYVGSDISRALQDVSDALRQVPDYPDEVDEPVIRASEGEIDRAIAWLIVDLDPAADARFPDFDVSTLYLPFEREVKPYLERVDGVAQVNIYGGREREVRVLLDPVALAQRGIGYQSVIEALRAENRNVSAGTIAEGKRDYRVRVLGQFTSADEILDTIVAYRPGSRMGASGREDESGSLKPVYVRDLGTVEIGYERQRGFVRSLGRPCLAMPVIRQSGANVMAVMEDVKKRLDEVRRGILPRLAGPVGPHIRLRQVYDETTYISSAIDLVISNLWKGGTLAIIALLLFLRSLKSTLVIAMAIPISVIGTFLVMLAAGRSLNVVSLAGLAFATGMVVDNAIVVLENIDRRRAIGDSPLLAVYRGAKEVWGAVLASTATTVAVFIPVLTVREEAGQLFFDLTLALAVSVTLSLIVAVTVIPAATGVLFRRARPRAARSGRIANLFGLVNVFGRALDRLEKLMYWLISGWRGWVLRPAIIVFLTGASILGSLALMPPIDYLPTGNRNLVFGGLLVPPGLSVDQMRSYSEHIEAQVKPYIEAKDPAAVAALPPIMRFDGSGKMFDPVGIENFFIGAFDGGMFVGGISAEEQVVIPIGNLLTMTMNTVPGAFGGARQFSIFGTGVGGGNSIDVEISGPRLERVIGAAQSVFGAAGARYGFGNSQPSPSNFNVLQPEWRVRLTDAGRELGLTTSAVGTAARGLFDGAYAGDFILEGRKIDISVLPLGGRLEYAEQLATIPLVTPSGRVVPVDSVVDIEPGLAPQQISRIEELPSVTVQITPPAGQPLEAVMDDIRENVVAPIEQAGLIDPAMRVRLKGSAAKLDEVRAALFGQGATAPGMLASPIRRALEILSAALVLAGIGIGAWVAVRGIRRRDDQERRSPFFYGAIGACFLGLMLAGIFIAIAEQPQLLTARFIWALAVTYLLMAALFESFLYPFVIMVSVPLGIVGGFAALRIVHEWTLANPTIPPQQLDVLTMIGFVILIGTVVNNAILLVEQSLNFMNPSKIKGFEDEPPLPPLVAIAAAVRSRVRPIFMTTLTTLGGGLPLVIAPGAGSEMYRGLGAVVCGGLLVSTIFTLILVPLLFSLVLEMRDGLRKAFARVSAPPPREGHRDESPMDGQAQSAAARAPQMQMA